MTLSAPPTAMRIAGTGTGRRGGLAGGPTHPGAP